MPQKQRRPSVGGLSGRQKQRNHGSGQAAVYFTKCITPLQTPSSLKACLVDLLRHLFEVRPTLAMMLGALIVRLWPRFRGA